MASARAMYHQLADTYRAKIVTEELKPGDRLPTEQELGEEFNITRGTVRDGLKVLVNEGLIVPARPRGYFVRPHELSYVRPQAEWRKQPASPEMDRWMEDQTVLGRTPSQHISVEIIPPPAKVAERLGLNEGDLVVARRRIRYIDDEPFNLNDSFYSYDLIKGSEILNPTDIPRGTNQALADLGYEQVRAIDEVEARMPLPDEVNRLQLGPGNPVLVHRVTGFTIDDKPVRCTVNVLIGSKHVMLFERSKAVGGSVS
ncbi:GntR family transcriptional regulator [Kibdelosporangium aridum]|nr:GntR family transcriptional regulator [Kibdelosporangium aridum]